MFELRIPKEIQRRVFELTLAVYRVTDFFPQGEVLRKHLREKANDIFGGMSEYGFSGDLGREAAVVIAKIQAIKGYFGIARSMRFVKPINITILEREYDFLADFFGRELERPKEGREEPPQTKVESSQLTHADAEELPTWQEFSQKEEHNGLSSISGDISDRQKTILEHLKQVEHAKISDLYTFFSGLSSKTVQRDLQDLVTKNFLKKEGEKRWTVYSLNGPQ